MATFTFPLKFTFTICLFTVLFLQPMLCDLSQGLSQGDPCTIQRQEYVVGYGVCTPLRECPSAIAVVQNRGYPTLCGFRGLESIVCCQGAGYDSVRPITLKPSIAPFESPFESAMQDKSDDTIKKSGQRISEQKCDLYSRSKGEFFGTISVVGGTLAYKGEFPHMAAVGYGEEDKKQWFCGGTLLSERFVLTAAHCLDTDYGRPKFIRLGDTDLVATDDDQNVQEFKIVETIPHPMYNFPSNYHDIALIKLDRDAVFGTFVLPACLFVNTNEDKQGSVTVTGWGQTGFTEAASNGLMKAPLSVTPTDECDRNYKTTSKRLLAQGIDERTQLCAAGSDDEKVKDACLGDSGGPLSVNALVDNEEAVMVHVVGVTSFGKACGVKGVPGVYTRVSYYVPWIEKIVWNN